MSSSTAGYGAAEREPGIRVGTAAGAENTLSEWIADGLRAAILNGSYRPDSSRLPTTARRTGPA